MFSCSDDDEDVITTGGTGLTGVWETNEDYTYLGYDCRMRLQFTNTENGIISAVYSNNMDPSEYPFGYELVREENGEAFITFLQRGVEWPFAGVGLETDEPYKNYNSFGYDYY